jgi:uncharacterized membrane protein
MEMSATIMIDRPVDAVFDYVMNLENDVHWRYGLTKSALRDGESLGVGALGYTVAGDREVDWRVVTYKPGDTVEWEFLSGPFRGRGGYRLEPAENGTQFTLISDGKPSGVYKLLGPLFARMGRQRNQDDVQKLRTILESMPA